MKREEDVGGKIVKQRDNVSVNSITINSFPTYIWDMMTSEYNSVGCTGMYIFQLIIIQN